MSYLHSILYDNISVWTDEFHSLIGPGNIEKGLYEGDIYCKKFDLDNITVVVDRNKPQIDGYTEDLNSMKKDFRRF